MLVYRMYTTFPGNTLAREDASMPELNVFYLLYRSELKFIMVCRRLRFGVRNFFTIPWLFVRVVMNGAIALIKKPVKAQCPFALTSRLSKCKYALQFHQKSYCLVSPLLFDEP
ncbi:MAG: hypothetical protein JWR61_1386 [Ferruginibacter sp.]|nr:hypothetical protein [Ferruginibacter sp.]